MSATAMTGGSYGLLAVREMVEVLPGHTCMKDHSGGGNLWHLDRKDGSSEAMEQYWDMVKLALKKWGRVS